MAGEGRKVNMLVLGSPGADTLVATFRTCERTRQWFGTRDGLVFKRILMVGADTWFVSFTRRICDARLFTWKRFSEI